MVEDNHGETFMFPGDYFSKDEVVEEVGKENIARFGRSKGWFARLSAPGYLDSTDWMGPFKTEEEAIQALKDQYGDDDFDDDEEFGDDEY